MVFSVTAFVFFLLAAAKSVSVLINDSFVFPLPRFSLFLGLVCVVSCVKGNIRGVSYPGKSVVN